MVSVYRTTGTTVLLVLLVLLAILAPLVLPMLTGRRSPNAAGVFDNSVMVALYGFNWHI